MSEAELNQRGIQLLQLNKSQQPNSVLSIDILKLEHSTTFTCLVNNSISWHEQSFLLKVRGKLHSAPGATSKQSVLFDWLTRE